MIVNTPDLSRAAWHKSTRSGDNGGACIEVAFLDTVVGLRDSKDRNHGPVVVCPAREWSAFIASAMNGEFNRP